MRAASTFPSESMCWKPTAARVGGWTADIWATPVRAAVAVAAQPCGARERLPIRNTRRSDAMHTAFAADTNWFWVSGGASACLWDEEPHPAASTGTRRKSRKAREAGTDDE